MIAPLVLWLAVAVPDPCAAPEPVEADPSAAQAYLAVAAEELSAGAPEAARAAYREALRRAPADPRARAGFAATCRGLTDLLAEGLERLASGDLPGAAVAFQAARRSGAGPLAALLEASSLVRAGEDARAREPLSVAVAAPGTADAARLLLGVLERRASDQRAARAWLEEAARSPDPRIGATARQLLPVTRRGGRVSASLYSGASWDSNARLAPDGVTPEDGRSDGSGNATAVLSLRPLGRSGPFAHGGLQFRRFSRFDAYDLDGWSAGAGWRLERVRWAASAGYTFLDLAMGGAPYLASHRAAAGAWGRAGQVFLSAQYAWSHDRYDPDYALDFTGQSHGADLRAGWHGRRAWVGVGYGGRRRIAADPSLSFLGHGPRVDAGAASGRGRLWAEASLGLRDYDAIDPALGVRRSEAVLEGSAGVDVNVAAGVSLRLLAGAQRSWSNVSMLSWEKAFGSVGIAWEGAWP